MYIFFFWKEISKGKKLI
ncbi:hypothetical protein PFNF54_05443 [Plasmodium falciparum NF54]|uniref:Uncharacterized protein n=1 Tax=Plasmodium falciparum (isolate NF54) TaxID=5843 RepID=W7JM50_PLAFO|nr:hypothetical protein PFNF54_05443 [Plasmodium falciparum NF54]